MKKSIVIGIIVTLVIGLIAAVPVFAKTKPFDERAVFESDIVSTDISDYDIVNGEAWIRVNGNYKVEIEGVTEDSVLVFDGTIFDVYLSYGPCPQDMTYLGEIVIEGGEGKLGGVDNPLSLQEDAEPIIANRDLQAPVIKIFEDGDDTTPQFCSGFFVEA